MFTGYSIIIMKITKDIQLAIEKAIDKQASQSKLAEISGIPQTNISKYLNGGIKVIREDCWDRLEPFIRPYLPPESRPVVAEERAACNAGSPSELPEDPLFAEINSRWPDLTRSQRYRMLAVMHELLEDAAPKHVNKPAVVTGGSIEDERREHKAAV